MAADRLSRREPAGAHAVARPGLVAEQWLAEIGQGGARALGDAVEDRVPQIGIDRLQYHRLDRQWPVVAEQGGGAAERRSDQPDPPVPPARAQEGERRRRVARFVVD